MQPPARAGGIAALSDYAGRIREFSRNARLLLAAATLVGLNAGVSSVLLNLYVLSLGYGEAFLGRLLSLGPLAALPVALVAGPLVDSWGPRRAMLAGVALAGGGAFALLLSPAPNALRTGIALISMGTVLVYIAVPPFLARHSTPKERTHLFGVSAAAYVVSTAAGTALGGYLPRLVAAVDAASSEADVYRLSLFTGAAVSALGVPLLALVREAPPSRWLPADGQPAAPAGAAGTWRWRARRPLSHLAGIRRLLRRDVVVVLTQFIVADALIRLGGNLVVPFFNVFFVRHLGASVEWYGNLRVAEKAIEVVAMLAVAPLALRFGMVNAVAATQLLSVPMLLALGFAPGLGLASAAFLLRGTLMEMTVPVRDSFMMEVVPEDARATASAALLLVGYGIAFFSTRAGGALIESGQFATAISITAALYVASALLYWHFFRRAPQAAPGRRLDLAAALAR